MRKIVAIVTALVLLVGVCTYFVSPHQQAFALPTQVIPHLANGANADGTCPQEPANLSVAQLTAMSDAQRQYYGLPLRASNLDYQAQIFAQHARLKRTCNAHPVAPFHSTGIRPLTPIGNVNFEGAYAEQSPSGHLGTWHETWADWNQTCFINAPSGDYNWNYWISLNGATNTDSNIVRSGSTYNRTSGSVYHFVYFEQYPTDYPINIGDANCNDSLSTEIYYAGQTICVYAANYTQNWRFGTTCYHNDMNATGDAVAIMLERANSYYLCDCSDTIQTAGEFEQDQPGGTVNTYGSDITWSSPPDNNYWNMYVSPNNCVYLAYFGSAGGTHPLYMRVDMQWLHYC